MRSSSKRLLCLILCFTLILVLFPVSRVEAVINDPVQYLTYTITDGTVTITDCDNTVTGYLEIPDTIEGLPVTAIDVGAFAFTSISVLIIPGSVTYTADNAFACDSLESVIFLGDPPDNYFHSFGSYDFWDWEDFKGTAYYPMHNSNWPSDFLDDLPYVDADIPCLFIGIHSWDKGTPIVTGTCTSKRTFSYPCTVCSKYGSIAMPALGHKMNNGIVHTQPTCTQNGLRGYSCINCTYFYTETIQATGHNWDDGTVISLPTCSQDGIRRYTCTNCSDTYEEAIRATGHTWDKGTVISQPTCDQDGVRRYICTFCSNTKDEAIPMTGHTWDNTTVITPASCTETGILGYYCSQCSAVGDQEIIPATGHSYESTLEAPTCTQPGRLTYTCTVCGDVRSTETSPATGHQFEDGSCIHCGEPEASPLTGDVNGDGKVNISDVARLYAHIKNTAPIEDEAMLLRADITGEGTVNICDAAKLYGHVRGTNPLP